MAFIIITLSAWFAWHLLFENKEYKWTERKVRHYYQFAFLLITAVVGFVAWHFYPIKWVKKIWLLSYGLLIIVFVSIGLIDRFFLPLSLEIRVAIADVRDFFLTPLPFLLLWFLSYIFRPTIKKP